MGPRLRGDDVCELRHEEREENDMRKDCGGSSEHAQSCAFFACVDREKPASLLALLRFAMVC